MLADANGLVEAMKRAALDAQESVKPVNIYFGEVTASAPLKIAIEQKMTLGEEQLILTRNVTDYKLEIELQWPTDTGVLEDETRMEPLHFHHITGKNTLLVRNALEAGDEVILIRQQEGQKFIVVDRIGGKK